MKSDKSLDILKRVILTNILFVLYILIINLSKRIFLTEGWSEEIDKTINVFCVYVSMILTVIYNLIAKRFLNLDYEKAGDCILSLVVFVLANIFYCYTVPMPWEDWGWFGSTFVRFELSLQSLSMYVFGNCVYTLICYFLRSIRNKKNMDMAKRAVLAIVLYIIYYTLSSEEYIPVFLVCITSLVYYLFSIFFLENSDGYIRGNMVSMSVYFCIIGVRYVAFGVLYSGLIITVSLFLYLCWCFIHFVIRRIQYSIRNKQR